MPKRSDPRDIPFDPVRGRVFLDHKAPFVYPNEILNDHGQLPQFHPRTEPAAAPTSIARYYPVTGDDVPDLSTIAEDYAGVSPMPAFNTAHEPGMYQGLMWESHIAQCHNMYYTDLRNKTGLHKSQIESLLAIVSYGMGHSMTWLPTFTTNVSTDGYAYQATASKSFNGMRMGNGCYEAVGDRDIVTDMNLECRRRIWGKRWLVAPIMYSSYPSCSDNYCHYEMSIFDRQSGHLYLQDTAYADCPLIRDERIQTAVHIWARFWNNMGLAHHFQYYVCKGTPQPEDFECGWLGVLWVMQNLRDQVGEQLLATGTDMDPDIVWFRDIPIGNYEPENYPYEDSSLHLRDWIPKGFSGPKEGLGHMHKIFYSMLRNELGLEGGYTPVRVNDHPAESLMRDLMRDPSGIPHNTFWTSFGGTQFVVPRNWLGRRAETHKAYDPSLPRRLHPPIYPFPDLNSQGVILNNDPDSHNPPRPLNATFNGKAFTANQPLLRRNHPTKIGIGDLHRHWEYPEDGIWEHHADVSVLPPTDANGASKHFLWDPNLRLRFSRTFSGDKKSVNILYRLTFLGGDTESVVGHFTFPVEDSSSLSSQPSSPRSSPNNSVSSGSSGPRPESYPSLDAAKQSPEDKPDDTSNEPGASSDGSQDGNPSSEGSSRKRSAAESIDAPEENQIPNIGDLRVDSSSDQNSVESSYSDRERRKKRAKMSAQGPVRRSLRIKKSTVFLGDPHRF